MAVDLSQLPDYVLTQVIAAQLDGWVFTLEESTLTLHEIGGPDREVSAGYNGSMCHPDGRWHYGGGPTLTSAVADLLLHATQLDKSSVSFSWHQYR